jgi:hypothetical protein
MPQRRIMVRRKEQHIGAHAEIAELLHQRNGLRGKRVCISAGNITRRERGGDVRRH